jgi:hypothetical protein
MKVSWDVDALSMFNAAPLTVPGRHRFRQAAIHRLKLTGIPNRAGVELFPTFEIAQATPRTAAYLANNAIPFNLIDEDLDQLLSGSFVTKVIYLPDRAFHVVAPAALATLVSARLGPGVDPIVEADRKGSIVAIIRVGPKDLRFVGRERLGAPAPDRRGKRPDTDKGGR